MLPVRTQWASMLDRRLPMSSSVKDLLDTVERLANDEKRQAIAAILSRARDLEIEPISDDELVLSAEALFLELDSQEEVDARS